MNQFQGLNDRFYKELNEEILVIATAICGGNIPSFEEYKRLTGRLDGLQYALDRHKELITLMEQANEQ